MFRKIPLSFLALTLVTLGLAAGASAADIPKVTGPVLYTSLGQSPDAKTFSVLAGRAKLEGEFVPLAMAKDVEASKTVFIVVGTSLKGFGSAGVNLETEEARCDEIVKAAKDKGVYLILAHIGGEGRRDSMTNLLLDKLSPSVDAFIVYEKGNGDGYFNKAAGDRPLVLVPKAADVAKVLEGLKP
jgi:hypothetical protein